MTGLQSPSAPPTRARRYDLAIFDLDGTLADSMAWFDGHLDAVADRYGFRRTASADREALRHVEPREVLARLGIPAWKLPAIARHMRRLKARDADGISLFPGTNEMLEALAAAGVRLALVSSDAETNARRQLGPANAALFATYACGASLLGKAANFRRVLRETRIPPDRVIAIGDEVRDIDAARAAGIAAGAVTWGYAAPAALAALGPDIVFTRLADVAPRLLGT